MDGMEIRRLTLDDLDECGRLAKDRHWLPEAHKWRLLFEVGEVYGIDAPDGDGLAATNILTRYGDGYAVIAMVLTASRYSRQGLGRILMEHVLEQAGDVVVSLHATEYGRPLYERLGFRTVSGVVTHKGVFTGQAPGRTRVATPGDLDSILAFDAFGADRSALLRRMPTFHEQVRVAERDGKPAGFGGIWRNDDTLVVGPLVAADLATAQDLMADLAAPYDEPVRFDMDADNTALVDWATAHGVTQAFTTKAMTRGGHLPGDTSRLFLPTMQALG